MYPKRWCPIETDTGSCRSHLGKNLCVQGLFGAGKSRAAAILLLGLMCENSLGRVYNYFAHRKCICIFSDKMMSSATIRS